MLTITIDTSNDAFADNPAPEVARILRRLAERLEDGALGDPIGRVFHPAFGYGARLYDVNGNTCGDVEISR